MPRFTRAIFFTGVIAASSGALAGSMSSEKLDYESAYWNGIYLGAQLGGGWMNANWEFTNLNFFNTLKTTLLGDDFNFRTGGVFGGGQLGFNYQKDLYVLGLEASLSGTDLDNTILSPFWPTDYFNVNVNGLGGLKGRLGYAPKNWMWYVDGGWTFANVSLRQTDPIAYASLKNWFNGWGVGAGVEYKFTPRFSAGIAYDYSEIMVNNSLVTCPLCGTGVGGGAPTVKGTLAIQSVMARLNYFINSY